MHGLRHYHWQRQRTGYLALAMVASGSVVLGLALGMALTLAFR
jgi:hypothetical protein